MTDILQINLGTAEQNGKDGDTIRVALGKASTNFAALNDGKLEKNSPTVSGLLTADALAADALTVSGPSTFKRSDGNVAVGVDPSTGNLNTNYDSNIGGALTVQKTLSVPNYGASFGGALTVSAGGAAITGALTQNGNINFRTNTANNSLLRFFSSVGSRANVGLNGAEAATDDGSGSNILFSQVVGTTVTNTLLLNRANAQAQFYKRPAWAKGVDPTTGPAFLTPWDNDNLKTPLDASDPLAARTALHVGTVEIARQTVTNVLAVNFPTLMNNTEFDSYELVFSLAPVGGNSVNGGTLYKCTIGVQMSYDGSTYDTSSTYIRQIQYSFVGGSTIVTGGLTQNRMELGLCLSGTYTQSASDVRRYSLQGRAFLSCDPYGCTFLDAKTNSVWTDGTNAQRFLSATIGVHTNGGTATAIKAPTGFRIYAESPDSGVTGFSGTILIYGRRKSL